MIRPDKKDYNLSVHYEVIKLSRDLSDYIDYLELDKQKNEEQKLPIDIVMPSFTDDERTQFVEETIMYNKQNLNGRETEDEIYEAGVCAGFDDLLEKLNEA